MNLNLVTQMQRIQGWRLWVLVSVIAVLMSELVVLAISLWLYGEISRDLMLTGLITSGIVAPPCLGYLNYLLEQIARVQAQMRASEQRNASRLNIALENAHMMLWEFDFFRDEWRFDDDAFHVLLLDPVTPPHTLESWLALVHEEDRPAFIAHFEDALRLGNSLFDIEYRYALPDGQCGWLQTKGQMIQRDTAGHPLMAVGSSMNITERKKAEFAFLDAQNRFELIFNNNPDVMVISRLPEGYITNVNDAFVKNTGYSVGEAIGNTTVGLGFWSNDERQKMTDAIQKNGYCRNLPFEFTLKDGQKRTGSFSAVVVRLQGVPHLVSTVHDVTELKRVSMALEEKNLFLNKLLQSIPIAIFYKDDQGRYAGCNDLFANLYGMTSHELIGKRVFDVAPEALADIYYARDQELMANPGVQIYETQFGSVTGNVRDVIFHKATFSDSSGQVRGIIGAVLDITEAKRAENTLRTSEAHALELANMLRLLCDNVPDMIWAKDMNKRFIFANKAICEQLLNATDTEEPIGRDDLYFALRERNSHPDNPDWHTFGELCQDSDTITLDLGSSAQFDEFGNVQGKFMYLDVHKAPFVNESGEIIGVVGSARNVTAQKEADEKLRLAALVLENSSEALLVSDADNRIVDINPAFTRLTGYELHEVAGKSPAMLHSNRQSDDFYLEMTSTIERTGRWQGEVWNRRKNGEIFAEWLTINTIYHDNGSVHRRVALFSDITERKKSEELIWTQANFDHLTHLPNRRMFRDRLVHDLRKAHRSGSKLALLFLDLDHFKEVNDTLGHDYGDSLLIETARRISACVRDSDTVARLGGDEFTVILAELDDISRVEHIAEKIIQSLTKPFHLSGEYAYVSASIGITLYPDDATEIEDMLKNADQAMFVSKRAGRNRFSFFTSAMQEAAQYRLHIINDLRVAVARQQFHLYFQPVIELASGKLHKAEALLRWFHPTRGLISPVEFIPLAEESGLIHEIGSWVFAEAVGQAGRWHEHYGANFQISVNMSPVQMQANHDSVQWFQQLDGLGLSGQNFIIEITEGLLLDSSHNVTSQLLAFRDAGIQVALDDFGTGYSALSYLKKMDIDYLKIDQSFIRNLAPGSSDLALSEAIVVMAHKLGLKVIAEGVETEAQHSLLCAIGCDYGQGYYYSRPLPSEEFEVWLSR